MEEEEEQKFRHANAFPKKQASDSGLNTCNDTISSPGTGDAWYTSNDGGVRL
jgi:hypothetical protein